MKKFIVSICLLFFPIITVFAQSVPPLVEQRIKQIYAEKYPDDYSMQKILIDDQLESYVFIQSWSSEPGVPQNVFDSIKAKHAQKYPDDYSMQKILMEDQFKSYKSLQTDASAPEVDKSHSDLQRRKEIWKDSFLAIRMPGGGIELVMKKYNITLAQFEQIFKEGKENDWPHPPKGEPFNPLISSDTLTKHKSGESKEVTDVLCYKLGHLFALYRETGVDPASVLTPENLTRLEQCRNNPELTKGMEYGIQEASQFK